MEASSDSIIIGLEGHTASSFQKQLNWCRLAGTVIGRRQWHRQRSL